jgi:hypothetical protein
MAKLRTLHSGLNRVRRFRATVRVGSALAVFASIVLGYLLAAFLLDLATHMGRAERAIVLAVFGVTTVWALRKYVAPALRAREEEVALALMVERQQGIGSDLVAALQFADGGRSQYGSSDLRQAVIDYTDEVSGHLNYLEGFSRKELTNRATVLAVTVLLAALPCVAAPAHVAVFANRFLLGNAHYPTRTVIESIDSPGDRSAFGQTVHFRVHLSGEMPEKARVELTALSSGLQTIVELMPDAKDKAVYTGELARALDDLSYQVFAGDAYTERRTLTLIPLPVVQVDLEVKTPAYAEGKFQPDAGGGRQRIALEGSRVTPVVTADKDLKSATITIDDKAFPMKGQGKRFTLDAPDSPLANVAATVRYEVQVVDADGLSLERPVSGILQVRADQPPRIAAATGTRYVLPTAAPRIKFKAIDDYALARILVHKTVLRQGKEEPPFSTSGGDTAPPAGDTPGAVPGGSSGGKSGGEQLDKTDTVAQPEDHRAELGGTIAVSLDDLGLEKGDRVIVTFEAVDYRGDAKGKSSRSERMIFQVTDRAGVLAAMRELDTQMDEKLDQIIKAQLGIGDQP